jgi:hypothetical protein
MPTIFLRGSAIGHAPADKYLAVEATGILTKISSILGIGGTLELSLCGHFDCYPPRYCDKSQLRVPVPERLAFAEYDENIRRT